MAHFILAGSLEVDREESTGKINVKAGVHTGNSEWEIANLRYIHGQMEEKETIQTTLERVYENTTGCLARGDFQPK